MADESIEIDLTLNSDGLKAAESQVKRVTQTLDELVTTLRSPSPAGGTVLDRVSIKEAEASKIRATAAALKEMAAAQQRLASSARSLNGVDMSKAFKDAARGYAQFATAMKGAPTLTKRQAEALNRTTEAMQKSTAATIALTNAETARIRAQALSTDAQTRQTRAAQEAAKQAEVERHNKATESLRREANETARLNAETAANSAAVRNNKLAYDAQYASLERSRYAARELAYAYGAMAVALGSIPVGGLKAFADQERAFADVRRTAQEAGAEMLSQLNEELRELATQTTLAFSELTKIATLGAQMNIPAEKLRDFSDAVGSFSTITGVSVEKSAEGFGRLATMMGGLDETAKGAGDGYKVLASEVAELGAKSVATEEEILNMSVAIATQGRQAGLTQDQVLALSSTLSSLAVGKEWARGSVQRIFGKINNAISEGGDKLRAFSSQLNMTDQEFVQLWRDDPNTLFMRLAESVANLSDKVERYSAVRGMGIVNVRDIELISRLAMNTGLWADQLDVATANGNNTKFLTESMSIIMGTLNAQWEALTHKIENVGAAFGQSFATPARLALKLLNGLLDVANALPGPVKAVIGTLLGFAAANAAINAAQAAAISLAGSYSRMKTAIVQSTGETTLSWRAVAVAWERARTSADRLNASEASLYAQTSKGVAVANAEVAAVNSKAVAYGKAATSAKAAAGATATVGAASSTASALLKGLFSTFGGWVGVGLTVAGVVAQLVASYKSAEEAASEAGAAIKDSMGGSNGIYNALLEDTRNASKGAAEGTEDLMVAVKRSGDNYQQSSEQLYYYVNASGDVVEASKAVAEQMGYTTLKISENTKELLINAIQGSDAYAQLSADAKQAIKDSGFRFGDYLKAAMSDDPAKAVDDYMRPIIDTYRERLDELKQLENQGQRMGLGVGHVDENGKLIGGGLSQNMQKELDALREANRVLEQLQSQASGAGEAFRSSLIDMTLAGQSLTNEMDEVSTSVDAVSSNFEDLNKAIKSTFETMFGAHDAAAATQDALAAVYNSIIEHGTTMDPNTEAGRANIDVVRAYMEALANEAAIGIEQLGLTGAEAQAYMYQTLQDAVNFLAANGVDVSMIADIPTQIAAILNNADYAFAGADTSVLDNSLNAAVGNAQSAVNNINNLLAQAQMSINSFATLPGTVGVTPFKFGTGGVKANPVKKSSYKVYAPSVLRPSASAFNPTAFAPNSKTKTSSGGSGGSGSRGGSGGGGSSAKKAAKSAAEIFEDFISRLKSALDRALNSWWDNTTAQDAYHKQLNSLKKNVEDTTKKIADLRKENEKLTVNLLESQQELHDAEFFNKVARKYGDTERVQSTAVDIASAQQKVKEAKDQIAANEREAASIEQNRFALTGYSEAAIENRASLKALQQTMVGLIENYAKTGASTQQVEAYTLSLKNEFIAQATQLGYNRAEVNYLAGAFDSLRATIGTVPRTVNVNTTDGGSTAATQRAIDGIHGHAVSMPVYADTSYFEQQIKESIARVKRINGNRWFADSKGADSSGLAFWRYQGGPIGGFAGGGLVPGIPPVQKNRDNLLATNGVGLYGLRSGEYVISQPAVDFYGSGLMKAINTMSLPVVPQQAQQVQSNSVMTLNPQQFAMLVQAVSTTVKLDSKTIGQSVNRSYVGAGNRGVY